jgi:hypothetical protein
MPSGAGEAAHGEEGTASVELVAAVPFLLLAVLVAAQSVAARAGARAALVGGDASAAARSALPSSMRSGVRVEEEDGVGVGVEVPRLIPSLPRLRVEAHSALEPGDG